MATGRGMWVYGGVTILQLFQTQNNPRGKAARVQVLKYYNRDNNKGVKGTENCDEEQIQQTRSRTALNAKVLLRLLRRRL